MPGRTIASRLRRRPPTPPRPSAGGIYGTGMRRLPAGMAHASLGRATRVSSAFVDVLEQFQRHSMEECRVLNLREEGARQLLAEMDEEWEAGRVVPIRFTPSSSSDSLSSV